MNKLATPAIEPRLITVPIERLSEATHGVRKTNGISITELAASIAAEGLLQNLTVVGDTTSPLAGASEFEHYTVVAGCRRTRALRLLAKENRLPAELRDGIPCRLIDESQALTASLAENTVRQAMHPADEFVAFRDMIAQGKSVDDVSARFGVTPQVVQRRLKLANVAPSLFEQFRNDKITLAQMMALAIVDDHAAQEKAWGKSKDEWSRAPDKLREALTKGEIDIAKDPVARFVGLREYERAGGHVHRDLFSDKDAGYITDKRLLQELATKKLAEVEERVRKEGWSFVIVRETISQYEDLNEYSRAEPIGFTKPDDAEKKQVAALKLERDEAGKMSRKIWDTERQDEAGELRDRCRAIEAELRLIEDAHAKWDPKILAKGGAMIGLDRNSGNLVIYRGLVKGKLRQEKDAKKGKAGAGATVAQQPGHSEALLRELTAAATFAIAAEMIAQPGSAVIALTHRLALKQFYPTTSAHSHPVKIEHEHTQAPNQALRAERLSMAVDGNADIAKLGAERVALQAMLPKKSDELLAWLIKDAGKTVQRLLVYCVAESIDVIAGDERDHRALPLAAALKLNMRPRWTAKRDNYLGRVNAATILAALKEAKVDKAVIGKAEKLKKSELADLAQPLLKTWLPKPLRFGAAESTVAKTKDRS